MPEKVVKSPESSGWDRKFGHRTRKSDERAQKATFGARNLGMERGKTMKFPKRSLYDMKQEDAGKTEYMEGYAYRLESLKQALGDKAYDHKYDDILYLPHHVSTKHPQMSLEDRAAQFSPFAALTGHKEVLSEAGRVTDARVELDENMKAILDEKLRILLEQIKGQVNGQEKAQGKWRKNQQENAWADKRPEAAITYFVPDDKKSGGSYRTIQGQIGKTDEQGQWMQMTDGTVIPICDIVDIHIEEGKD